MSGYVETYRGHVLASECDALGHMNVQFYNACIGQAMASMFTATGIPPEDLAVHKRGFATIDQRSQYYSELLAGDIVHMESTVLKHSTKTVTFHHRLYNSATNQLSYESTLVSAFMDLTTRKAIPLEPNNLSLIEDLIVEGDAND